MPKLKPYGTNDVDQPFVKNERKLMNYLQSAGQLSLDADLQDLLQWGHERGISTRDNLRRLGKKVGSGNIDTEVRRKCAPTASMSCAPQTRADLQYLKVRQSPPTSVRQERGTDEPNDTTWKEMDWTRTELEMVLSELAALTHLQITGQLPLDSGLASLLDWCRKLEVSRNQLREAGNKIQFSESASQGAYQERLDRFTREWKESNTVNRDVSRPKPTASDINKANYDQKGVDMAVDRADLNVLDRTRPFWLRSCKPSLADFKYPSIFTRSRLADSPTEQIKYIDVSMVASKRALLAHLQGTGELPPDAQLPEMSVWGYANGLCHREALRVAGNPILRGKPMRQEAEDEARREDSDPSARQEIQSLQQVRAAEEDDTTDCSIEYVADLDLMRVKRLAAMQEQELTQYHVQTATPPPDALRNAQLAEYDYPNIFALPVERGRYNRRIDADSIASLRHNHEPELQDLEGDFVLADNEDELDIVARRRVTNGKLLDDMDIDGV